MKKISILICALIPALSVFAYGYSSYGSDEMSGFAIFTLIVMIAYIILSIVILVRWWNMTNDVKQLREKFIPTSPTLTYLIAIGEKEQADKTALKMVVDLLYPIYGNLYIYSKAKNMNEAIKDLLPRIKKLGIELPDYVTSGEKFIDYMNNLTGKNIPYDESQNNQYMN